MGGHGPIDDTSLGGPQRAFPSTCWSKILAPRDADERQKTLDSLARSYWKPIYAHIRARLAKSNEDAKDLAQDFFIWLLEGDFLARADPERGRFRSFVRAALLRFLSTKERDRTRQKRGGGRAPLSFDAVPPEMHPESPEQDPERAFEDAWRNELLVRAAKLLEDAYRGEGTAVRYSIFRDYCLSADDTVDYEELSRRYKITTVDVANHLARARERYRGFLRDLVAETVEGASELEEEMRALFGGADLAGAIADFDRALEVHPDWADAHVRRGDVKRVKGETAGAIADLEAALREAPADWPDRRRVESLLEHVRGTPEKR